MILKFGFSCESSEFQLVFSLLSLLNEIPAAINNFGLNKSLLVEQTGSLNHLNKCFNELHAKTASVAVDILLLKDSEHLGYIWDEIKWLLIYKAVRVLLFSQKVLEIAVVAFCQKLKESEKSHGSDDVLLFNLVD